MSVAGDDAKPPSVVTQGRRFWGPRRAFVVLVVVAVAAMLVGVALGRMVRSPAQQLADAEPPALSVITAEVTERELAGEVVSRGTIAIGRTVSVGPVTSSSTLSVITGVAVEPGATVKAGAPLLEVSGRPVLLLQGEFPAYRDLRPGDEGPDAAMLNQALASLTLSSGAGDEFTAETSEGLAKLYRGAGYEPAPGGGLDLREVVFVPAATASVLSVGALVGQPSEAEELVVLASGETSVTANLPPAEAATVEAGNAATIFLDDGSKMGAEVTVVEPGETLAASTVSLRPDSDLDPSLNGRDVRVSIAQSLTGASVLTVPVPAIFSRPDGQTAVVRVDDTGTQEVLPVTVGDIVGGFATITQPDGAAKLLVTGDQVVVSGPGLE
ncbi:MAG TPA: hypothetical protein PKE40_14670 [Arachnia sp.]|nr:hypothetical protein [Arachnia sp.]HMT87587.1 hypothetical protein [Arachnia sp.]